MAHVLVTGAAGRVAGFARPALAEAGHRLRLLDIRPIEADAGEEVVAADIRDPDAVAAALQDVDVVVHLAGALGNGTARHQIEVDVHGTWTIFDQARRAGVRRVVYASSNHAAGFTARDGGPVSVDIPARPDTLYGVNKVFGEATARYHHDRYGLEVVCVRIGTAAQRPRTVRSLATWLSPGDTGRLLTACVHAPGVGYSVVWGISANTRAWWDLSTARALGYEPRDDAEKYAQDILDERGDVDPSDPELRLLGGGDFPSREAPDP